MPVWLLLALLAALAFFMLPTFISFKRDHQYKYVIFALNITGVFWIVAFLWAVFPDNKTLADPIIGTVNKSNRNIGDITGEVLQDLARGKEASSGLIDSTSIEKLERLFALKEKGAISKEEFLLSKEKIFGERNLKIGIE